MSSVLVAQSWQSIGPGPLHGGQNEGITNRPVIGAIHGIATHPADPDIIYVAAVNGGIWKTNNATAASPTWVAQTDNQASMSMGDVEFDITDGTFQTLVAGSGRFSSFGRSGGDRVGVLRTINGGSTWTDLNGGMDGRNITSVEARGTTLLAAVDVADSFTCENIGIFRSTDTGTSWLQLSSTQGIPKGGATALVADPLDSNTFYAGVHTFDGACSSLASGIYKTTDSGVSWDKVSNEAMDAVIGSDSCHFEIAVGKNVGTNPLETGNVFVSMVCGGGFLNAVFRSGNAGSTWTAMSIPETTDNEGVVGIHPGGQGRIHSSIAADPTNDNIVYIGGDRQPFGFPNSIGANDYSGRLFRGDASQPLGTQWTPLTHIGTASNSSSHADSRDMQFDSSGILLESDDGGIFKRLLPRSTAGDWFSINGDLKITEQHDATYDANSAIVVSGNQDNGTSVQSLFASTTWENYFNADGGDVVVDAISLAGSNQSARFYSFQNLGAFSRVVYDENNNIISQSGPALTIIDGGNSFVPQFVTPLAVNNTNGNRMIISGGNSVYETLDQGDTLSEIGAGITVRGFGRNNIAYGATDNADILYVGACQGSCLNSANGAVDGVFIRTIADGILWHAFTPSSGSVQGITINPDDSTEAFIIEGSRVLHTSNTGTNWMDITGNLSDFGQLRSIAFMSHMSNSRLVVGTNRGIFQSRESEDYSIWETPAEDMPNVPVFDLKYDVNSDRLIAGTLGRGSFALSGALNNNLPPVIGADIINVAKGGVATTLVGGSDSLIENDSDPDLGDILTLSTMTVSDPINGLVTLSPDGDFLYQHDGSFTNSDQFFYRVCDNGSSMLCTDGQVDITIDLGEVVCSNPNVSIPDDDVNGINDTLTMVESGAIIDLNVFLEINHTLIGDVSVTLTHVSSATEITLLDQPGVPALSPLGCAEDDISAALDDEAATAAEDQCSSPIAMTGSFIPSNPLSGFDGIDLSGNWRLNVTDSLGGETGSLISWCLEPTTANSFMPPVLNSIGNHNVNELEELIFTATASDSDTAQNNLIFSLFGEPAGATITSNGDFSFTPTEAQGSNIFTFEILVMDDSIPPITDSEIITVTAVEINQNPLLLPIGNRSVEELDTLNFSALVIDNDLPIQTFAFSLSGEPIGANITSDGNFSFTPTEVQGPGNYTFDVIVTDNGTDNLTDSEAITIFVSEDEIIYVNGFEVAE